MNILVFGGDNRQIAAAKYLENKGCHISIYAIDKEHLEKRGAGHMFTERFGGYDALLLPLPLSRDGKHINCPLSETPMPIECVISSIKPGALVLAGLINKYQKSLFTERRLRAVDYYDIEELQIKNSVPTAEGAIEIFMNRSEKTVMGSKTVVIGYGKIAKALSSRLLFLGSDVKIAARSEGDLAAARCCGCEIVKLSFYRADPGECDCIFNTVPCNLFDETFASKIPSEAIFIDLASKPFGMTPNAAEMLGDRYIIASSLPGRMFPQSAGIIIGETVWRILETI